MVGIEADGRIFVSGRVGRLLDLSLAPDWLSCLDRLGSSTGFSSASFGFQLASKLTIGLSGLSLTTAGVGSLGLLSLILLLVA